MYEGIDESALRDYILNKFTAEGDFDFLRTRAKFMMTMTHMSSSSPASRPPIRSIRCTACALRRIISTSWKSILPRSMQSIGNKP